jgi:chromosome segregation ATPase
VSENAAVIKIIANHTKEYNELLKEHNTLLKVHVKSINICAEIECKRYELRKENKDLRAVVVRFERDNERLQESLDQAQQEIERLADIIEEWNTGVKSL